MLDALGFLGVLAVTVALTPLLMRYAAHWRLVDVPDTRKLHAGSVPVVGGIAMGLALLLALAAIHPVADNTQFLALAGAVVVTLCGGVLDDRFNLRASLKFAFQIAAAALLVVWGGALLTHLGNLMSENLFTLGRWSVALSIFAIVGVMNAINMADGVDGLAGSLVLAACLGFGYMAVTGGNAALFTAICLTAGAVAGFLLFNLRPPSRGAAAVYMGDTGSLLLGLLLAWFAIRLAMDEHPALAPITAVWIVGLPIADTVTIMLRRMLRGRSPFLADREHLHHILAALGLSQGRVVGVMCAIAIGFAAIGIAAERMSIAQHVMFYAYVAWMILHGVCAELACRRLRLR